jgi:acetolactate decarboxylase
MHALQCRLSDSLWHALQARHRATGESIDHMVRAALAEYLQVDHSTLFQISSSAALVEGIYKGEVTVGALREHGDFGLGTFAGLDGEMVVVDGRFYQVRGDGVAREVDDGVSTPFAVVTRFVPERSVGGVACASLAELFTVLDRLRDSDNAFYAIRVDGEFARLHTRAMCRTAEGVPLVEAAAHQPEFELRQTRGTMIGFWSPAYARALSVPGYHLHALTSDRTAGGHVLDCAGRDLRIQVQRELDLRVSLPHSAAFLNADLTRDPTDDLDRAEH